MKKWFIKSDNGLTKENFKNNSEFSYITCQLLANRKIDYKNVRNFLYPNYKYLHNPFLMNQNIFHPQQLYIVNKKSDLSSEIYSFDDFDLRNDKNKLYEDYLKGRFGGASE